MLLRAVGAARRAAAGEVLTVGFVRAGDLGGCSACSRRRGGGDRGASTRPRWLRRAPEPSGDFIGWVRAVDASMTDAERAAGEAEAAAAARCLAHAPPCPGF